MKKIAKHIYHAKNRLSGKDAQIIGEYLATEKITKARELYERAKAEDHFLHNKYFVWDKDKATELYNIHIARNIINDIGVEIVYEDGETIMLPEAYPNVKEKDVEVGNYLPVMEVMNNEKHRDYVIKVAFNEMKIASEKYNSYIEFSKIQLAIKDVEEDLKNRSILQ